jgi:hypothetical protein
MVEYLAHASSLAVAAASNGRRHRSASGGSGTQEWCSSRTHARRWQWRKRAAASTIGSAWQRVPADSGQWRAPGERGKEADPWAPVDF